MKFRAIEGVERDRSELTNRALARSDEGAPLVNLGAAICSRAACAAAALGAGVALLFFGNELKKALGGTFSGVVSETPIPPAPGRTVDLGKLLGRRRHSLRQDDRAFVEWRKKRV
jgi:hypothetical protein